MPSTTLKTFSRASVVMVSAVILSGCGALISSPSPTSSYLGDSGETVTVDWVDYPAHAGNDGAALLDFPDQTQLEPEARQLMDALRASIDDTLGVEMTATEPERDWFADDNWFVQQGNGYGGDSLLVTVNCCDLTAEGSFSLGEQERVLDEASRVAQDAGLGPFVREAAPDFCVDSDDQCWHWGASATDGVQWVYLTVEDRERDPTGDAIREAEELDIPLARIMIGYGATVVQAARGDDFRRAMQPFEGLRQPTGTTSD